MSATPTADAFATAWARREFQIAEDQEREVACGLHPDRQSLVHDAVKVKSEIRITPC